VFLSASTDSTVGLLNCTVRDLKASGEVLQAVSSVIQMTAVSMLRITYTVPTGDANFYKVAIVNKARLTASNCTFDRIAGLLLYVSGSTLTIYGNSTFSNAVNDDPTSTLVAIDTSTVVLNQTVFNNLSSVSVSPLFSFQELAFFSNRLYISGFDKTLFALSSGVYEFSDLQISKGKMVWQQATDAYMVNSVVFDVVQADLSLTNSSVDGIFSNYSSPVIYIDNDSTASQQQSLVLKNSSFTNNVANMSAGVVLSVNTNLTVDWCVFANNAALLGDGGSLYLSCDEYMSIPCSY